MPQRTALAIVVVAVVSWTACAGDESPPGPEPAAEPVSAGEPSPSSQLLSSLHMADPRAEEQLLRGFHQIEGGAGGAWRWTERVFAVALKPPAAGRLVRLELTGRIAGLSIEKLGPITLSATIGGTAVGSETFSNEGDIAFSKPVAAELIEGGSVEVLFELDKALPPGDADARELGLVISSIALQ